MSKKSDLTNINLYLIRHAQSVANTAPELIGGRSPQTPLTEIGKEQSKKLGERFLKEQVQFDAIYCSPLVRTKQTCEIVCQQMGFHIEDVIEHEDLVEFSQGSWEGEKRAEIYTPEMLGKINTAGKYFLPPEGESQRMVERRFSNWLEDEILYNPKYRGGEKNIAIFSHGLTISCGLHYILGFNDRMIYRIKLGNTAISKIKYTEDGFWLEGINDTAHLSN